MLNFLSVLTHIRMVNILSQFSFQISLIVIVTISFVTGQNLGERRANLKFRPEWFQNIQPSEEQSQSDFEQSDQPAQDEFDDIYVDEYEPQSESHSGGPKFVRHPSMDRPVFQSLCVLTRDSFLLNDDPIYEYRPSSYQEISCKEFLFSKCRTTS